MATKKPSDFDAGALLKTTDSHTEELKNLSGRVGDNESFAKTFVDSAEASKKIDEYINGIIDKRDTHIWKVGILNVLKWVAMLIVGGFIGGLITKAFAL